ncbi:PRC-barrel domain-containing protein [Sphingomonas naphthae]|uniref:PRC-barrel domain-containing protein n=1 Tax=Sphingomonas naphthae TaxID=1813468 RepID=A0ABY7THB7_9SPHN|nr:PRC-barrel domain-containing protein [Sphingomonas naphthae]WCT71830.1 PRC-barrel domain-containing protein [Sphingomonas naphthae]
MNELAGWVAPAATMIAAMMTAANLGARFTGWGFVVFLLGSIGWVIVAATSGQTNLLLTNGFLAVVNLVGIWRWLGRQARYEAGGREAAERSEAKPVRPLLPVGSLADRSVVARDGGTLGHVVDAMLDEGAGRIAYLVVRTGGVGGVGETLHGLGWGEVTACEAGRLVAAIDAPALAARPALEPDAWPASAREAGIA